jgi:hypothetical protein
LPCSEIAIQKSIEAPEQKIMELKAKIKLLEKQNLLGASNFYPYNRSLYTTKKTTVGFAWQLFRIDTQV